MLPSHARSGRLPGVLRGLQDNENEKNWRYRNTLAEYVSLSPSLFPLSLSLSLHQQPFTMSNTLTYAHTPTHSLPLLFPPPSSLQATDPAMWPLWHRLPSVSPLPHCQNLGGRQGRRGQGHCHTAGEYMNTISLVYWYHNMSIII